MAKPMECDGCDREIEPNDQWGLLYDNEQYYPHAVHLCEVCKKLAKDAFRRQTDGTAYDEGWRKGRSAATEAVRRENSELRNRLRITTELLEGRTPTV